MLDLQQVILMLQAQSNARGFLTFDQISAAFPVDLVSADDIETVMAELKSAVSRSSNTTEFQWRHYRKSGSDDV